MHFITSEEAQAPNRRTLRRHVAVVRADHLFIHLAAARWLQCLPAGCKQNVG